MPELSMIKLHMHRNYLITIILPVSDISSMIKQDDYVTIQTADGEHDICLESYRKLEKRMLSDGSDNDINI